MIRQTKKKQIIGATIAGLFIFIGICTGCAGRQETRESLLDGYNAQKDTYHEIHALNQKLFATVSINNDPGDYMLGHGDLLQVTVFEVEELETEVRVSSRGFITLPLLGQLKVKGRSVREAELLVEELYRKSYIKKPHVTIFVKENFSQRITLVGQVKNPGTYDYIAKQRLLEVLVLSGGLSDKAGRIVQIRRKGEGNGEQNVFMVDLDKLITEGQDGLNIEINGGDVIFIPEAGVFFVDGAVRRPGSYPIRQRTTLREALQTAGGFQPWADPKEVLLVRYLTTGKKEIIKIDLTGPKKEEVQIKDRDVIFADTSVWGKIKSGSWINFGIPGIFGIGYRNPDQ